MPLRRQAEAILLLPPRERLEALLHAPAPMRLVRLLPNAEFYLIVRETGPSDALPILSLASAVQITHLIDMESWRRDRFDGERSGGWIALLCEAGDAALIRFVRSADDELLALLFARWARTEEIEGDFSGPVSGREPAGDHPDGSVLAPDGHHRFRPELAGHAPAVLRLAETLLRDDPDRYGHLLLAARHALPSELEEDALRWRQSRLEEHGYPPLDEAVAVYRPPSRATLHPEPLPPTEPDAVAVPRAALRQLRPSLPLIAAVRRLPDPAAERALHELASLAQHILVADSSDLGDPEAHRASLERAASYVALALDGRGAGSADGAVTQLLATPMMELFREGYGRAADLRQRAVRWVRAGWPARHPRAMEILDVPLRPRVLGLLEPRPLYYDPSAETHAASYRDFRSTAEIDETATALEIAEVLGRVLLEKLGLDVDAMLSAPAPGGEVPRSSALWLTALAWHAVRDELRASPLTAEATTEFLRRVASRRTAPAGAPRTALEAFLGRLGHEVGLTPRETAGLRAFGLACLERLEEEVSRLDPDAPLDRRFVTCLILEEKGSR